MLGLRSTPPDKPLRPDGNSPELVEGEERDVHGEDNEPEVHIRLCDHRGVLDAANVAPRGGGREDEHHPKRRHVRREEPHKLDDGAPHEVRALPVRPRPVASDAVHLRHKDRKGEEARGADAGGDRDQDQRGTGGGEVLKLREPVNRDEEIVANRRGVLPPHYELVGALERAEAENDDAETDHRDQPAGRTRVERSGIETGVERKKSQPRAGTSERASERCKYVRGSESNCEQDSCEM